MTTKLGPKLSFGKVLLSATSKPKIFYKIRQQTRCTTFLSKTICNFWYKVLLNALGNNRKRNNFRTLSLPIERIGSHNT